MPPIKAKKSDSRWKEYVQKFGNNVWEVEALPPRTTLRIVEQKLREHLSKEFLEELRLREETEKIIRPIERRLVGRIRRRVIKLKKEGLSKEEIARKLTEEND